MIHLVPISLNLSVWILDFRISNEKKTLFIAKTYQLNQNLIFLCGHGWWIYFLISNHDAKLTFYEDTRVHWRFLEFKINSWSLHINSLYSHTVWAIQYGPYSKVPDCSLYCIDSVRTRLFAILKNLVGVIFFGRYFLGVNFFCSQKVIAIVQIYFMRTRSLCIEIA